MTTLVVPPLDRKPWPTLGPQVLEFIEENLVHGPGDLRGEPPRIDDEFRALVYRAYEIYPRDHPRAGRRRFKTVAWSLRKGTAKTEKAAWLAACELHPEASVRCAGWRRRGRAWEPVGRGVRDPYVPMVAYTEEQTEELAYSALYVILSEGPLAGDFDIGLDRIIVLGPRGEAMGRAVALAAAPNSRDGARTTFQHFDETHRFHSPRLRDAYRTMQANLPKRFAADAWGLETTTAYTPGEESVAEGTHKYAKSIAKGEVSDPRLFYFHREASDDHDLSTPEGVRAAIVEASGPAAEWSDIDNIAAQWADPRNDKAYLERVWLNRPRQGARQAFDVDQWDRLARPDLDVPRRALVTLGFDGSRFLDATALIGTWVPAGHQFVVGIWERPDGPSGEGWEVPEDEVDAVVQFAFDFWTVWRMYCDPAWWETAVKRWQGLYPDRKGKPRVQDWWTNRDRPMAAATRAYSNAQKVGDLTHDGNQTFRAHIGNAQKRLLPAVDPETGEQLWVMTKERSDSPRRIDVAMAGCLSWEARNDAIAAGAKERSMPSALPSTPAETEGGVFDAAPLTL